VLSEVSRALETLARAGSARELSASASEREALAAAIEVLKLVVAALSRRSVCAWMNVCSRPAATRGCS
jgi:hypothetical protein